MLQPACNGLKFTVTRILDNPSVATLYRLFHKHEATYNRTGHHRTLATEAVRLGAAAYRLDPTAFPNASTLKANTNLGRLNLTNKTGDIDGDGDFDRLYAFGARSFSIWDANGVQVYDSADEFERFLAATSPATFNVSHTNNTRKNRGDDKGPEPEGAAIGNIGPQRLAFIGLERDGGVLVYDITNPTAPVRVGYASGRKFTEGPAQDKGGDLGPEGLTFVPAADSPTGKPLLIVGYEVSGTTAVWEVHSAGDATSNVAISFAGFAINRSNNTATGTITLTNTGSSTITGPLYLTLPGVTLTTGAGQLGNTTYIPLEETSLRSGGTARVNVTFSLPTNPTITNPNQILNTLRPQLLAGNL
ncbi:MAG TPA: hypothetical protein VE621_20975 [Bryobacteraceae bacterium]|nr:hypothetical protein [Bryobacteraceae bacterium]